jgi:polysaccharide pyruvyl transferase CsaB
MSKVLISGYYGFDNAGDDTVLYGIINSLQKQLPTLEIAVLSNKPKETEALFGIPAYNRWSFAQIFQQLRRSDLLLMGGGSLLQDATSPRSVMYYLGIVQTAKLLGKPVIFFAQGFGPITHPFSKALVRIIVNKVDTITVRDQQSAQDMESLGVNRPIIITADPAVAIDPHDIDLRLAQKWLALTDKPKVMISTRKWKHEETYKQEIAKMADEMLRQGWMVYFLPMQFPADIVPSQDIMKYMNEPGSQLLTERMNFNEIISFIGNMDFVIGMRLHSLIIAAVLGVPFVGISYDPKIDRFLERVGMDGAGSIQTLRYEKLQRVVNKNLGQLPFVRSRLKEQMNSLVEEAAKSSELAVQLLTNQKR